MHRAFAVLGLLGAVLFAFVPTPSAADGAIRTLTLPPGCWEIQRAIVGLDDDGAGAMEVPAFTGQLELAILTWAGSDDLTPQALAGGGRADSQLTINGTVVTGVQLPGETGNATFPENEWYVWEADVSSLLRAGGTTLDISGWDANWTTADPERRDHTNGALLSVVTDNSPCAEPVSVDIYQGLDYVHHAVDVAGQNDDYTESIIFPMTNMPVEQTVEIPVFFAGTEYGVDCRGLDLWGSSGANSALPANAGGSPNYNASYDIFANQNSGARLVNNAAVNQLGTCSPGWSSQLAGVRATGVEVIGAADDVSAVVAQVVLPPNQDWLALQMESVAADNGESGAWVLSAVVNRARPDALGDTVWIDENRNCVQDPGEPGLAGATVRFTADPARTITRDAVLTDANGKYIFEELPIGTHQVTFELPPGYEFTEANCTSTTDILDSDAVPSAANARISNPIPGEIDGVTGNLTLDAGVIAVPIPPGSIGDFVWLDANRDGCQDPGERGVSGVSVTLRQNGQVVSSTRTDASGRYLFQNLAPGDYQVSFNAPTGTEPTASGCARGVDVDSNGTSSSLTLSPDSSDLSVDFGVVELEVPETLAFTGLSTNDMAWLAALVLLGGLMLAAGSTKRAWNLD